MSKTYTIGVEFIETDERAGKPERRALTWTGEGDSEQDAIKRCCEWYGFEEDGIEVTDIRVLGVGPTEDENAHAAPRETVAPAKKKAAKKKAPAKKPAAKKASVKKAVPDYSAMTLEELAIESGMAPERVTESLAGLLMLGDTVEGIREHLLAKLAKRKATSTTSTTSTTPRRKTHG